MQKLDIWKIHTQIDYMQYPCRFIAAINKTEPLGPRGFEHFVPNSSPPSSGILKLSIFRLPGRYIYARFHTFSVKSVEYVRLLC